MSSGTARTIPVATVKSSDVHPRGDDKQQPEQTETSGKAVTGSSIGSGGGVTGLKHLLHHRFTVNDILSPLNSIGKQTLCLV